MKGNGSKKILLIFVVVVFLMVDANCCYGNGFQDNKDGNLDVEVTLPEITYQNVSRTVDVSSTRSTMITVNATGSSLPTNPWTIEVYNANELVCTSTNGNYYWNVPCGSLTIVTNARSFAYNNISATWIPSTGDPDGTYRIQLTVVDSIGNTNMINETVTIYNMEEKIVDVRLLNLDYQPISTVAPGQKFFIEANITNLESEPIYSWAIMKLQNTTDVTIDIGVTIGIISEYTSLAKSFEIPNDAQAGNYKAKVFVRGNWTYPTYARSQEINILVG